MACLFFVLCTIIVWVGIAVIIQLLQLHGADVWGWVLIGVVFSVGLSQIVPLSSEVDEDEEEKGDSFLE